MYHPRSDSVNNFRCIIVLMTDCFGIPIGKQFNSGYTIIWKDALNKHTERCLEQTYGKMP